MSTTTKVSHDFIYRAAISGTSLDLVDLDKAGQWRSSRDDAMSDASELAIRLGEKTNIVMQSQIASERKRDNLNRPYKRAVVRL